MIWHVEAATIVTMDVPASRRAGEYEQMVINSIVCYPEGHPPRHYVIWWERL